MLPEDPSFHPGSSGELDSRSTTEALGLRLLDGQGIHSLGRHRLGLHCMQTWCSGPRLRGGKADKNHAGEERIESYRKQNGHRKTSEGMPCDLRPAGGDSSVLGNMSKDKALEAGVSLPVLRELEGGSGARAACAGAPEPPLSHLPAVRTIHAPEMAFGGNTPTSCLARGD